MPYQYYIGGIAQALKNKESKSVSTILNSTGILPNKLVVKGHDAVSNVSENHVKHFSKRKLKDKNSDKFETNKSRKKVKPWKNLEKQVPVHSPMVQTEKKSPRKKICKNRVTAKMHNQQTHSGTSTHIADSGKCITEEEILDKISLKVPVEKKSCKEIPKNKASIHNQQTCSVDEQIDDSVEKIKKEDPEKEARTIFVGNLPLSIKRKDLKVLFSCYGRVESVRQRSVVPLRLGMPKKVAVIQNKFNAEKDNINAYVVMDSIESASRALECNGSLLQGHHIKVDLAGRKEHDHKLSVFVGNLPFNCQDEELYDFFSQSLEVKSVRVIRDSQTGICKGFGFIMFKSKDCVELAMKMDGEFKGRHLRIMRSKKQKKPSKNTAHTGMQNFERNTSFEGIKSNKGAKERKRVQRKIKFANMSNKQSTGRPK